MRIGVIPAAGKGSRIGNTGFSKELLPIFEGSDICCIDYLISSYRDNNIEQTLIAINKEKTDIVKHVGNTRAGSYYFKTFDSPSLAHSILAFSDMISNYPEDGIVVFGLPDVVFTPRDAFSSVIDVLEKGKFDICLGLFDDQPSNLYDSVSIQGNQVTSIAVKKTPALSPWFWGLGAMTFKSYLLLAADLPENTLLEREFLFGEHLNRFIMEKKVKIGGVKLVANTYHDLGTPERYKAFFE